MDVDVCFTLSVSLVPGIDFVRSAAVSECLVSATKQSSRRKLNSGENGYFRTPYPESHMVDRFRACALGAKLPALIASWLCCLLAV